MSQKEGTRKGLVLDSLRKGHTETTEITERGHMEGNKKYFRDFRDFCVTLKRERTWRETRKISVISVISV